MSTKKGTEFKLYASASTLADTAEATIDALSWTEGTFVKESENNSTREDNTFIVRQNGGTTISSGGSVTDELTFEIAYDTTDSFFTILQTAYDADNEVALADVDGTISTSGTKGRVGNFNLKEFSISGPNTGEATVSVRAVPTAIYTRTFTQS